MKKHSNKKLTLAVLALASLGVIGSTPVLRADWNPGDPYKMHYPQLPDMSPQGTGLDVLATYNGYWFNPVIGAYEILPSKILADDFLCTETGPITDIHIWGSWLYDAPDINPMFHLSIHADIPAAPGSYSRPGQLLWATDIAPTKQRLYGQAPEQFYEPNSQRILGPEHQVWQYNFLLNPTNAFVQQQGTVYWLDVQYFNPVTGWTTNLFGWKTSLDHWNDDAVFGDNEFGPPGGEPLDWNELIYPPGHPLAGQSMDLAFVITVPEPNAALLVGLATGLLVLFGTHRNGGKHPSPSHKT